MKKQFLIKWMTCASCLVINRDSLTKLEWVSEVAINLATGQSTVSFNENIISFENIKKEILANWYSITESDIGQEDDGSEYHVIFKRFLLSLIFSIPVFSMMFIDIKTWIKVLDIDLIMYIFALLSFVVVFILGKNFHKNAIKSLSRFNFNMDSLVSLWTSIAFIYSVIAMFLKQPVVYFEASVAIITLINLWKLLEYKAKTRAWDAIKKLVELWVKKATIKLWDGSMEKRSVDDIDVWDIIVVKAWWKIALDWVIVKWTVNCDESMLTGESIPVFKQEGDECYWWTINLDGGVEISVNKTNKDGTLANIIKLVNNAQSSKAPIEHLADRVSSVFVPVIIIISIVTFASWFFITWNLSKAIITSVASLVIACPCALWLATPTAIMVWTWVWAKRGILIKDAWNLEKTKDIDVIAFDKTGTLTKAKPEVTDVTIFSKDEKDFIAIVKSLSVLSNHPLSKAISKYWGDVDSLDVEDFEELRWKWLIWTISWEQVKIWNKKLFKNIGKKILKKIEDLSGSWKTPILVWNDEEVFWVIWLLDLPKPWVKKTIDKLYDMWLDIIMLTWDTKKTANFIAKEVWIKKVFAESMPEDKLAIIRKLQDENKKVAFVWDGINDAPALIQSDLSISMWTGSDIAIELSDIVLVEWNLEKVVSAINLSRRTLKTIKQNLFWAFVYNSIGIPLAVFWILDPIFASFAMSMSSVSVIANSLRLRKFK